MISRSHQERRARFHCPMDQWHDTPTGMGQKVLPFQKYDRADSLFLQKPPKQVSVFSVQITALNRDKAETFLKRF